MASCGANQSSGFNEDNEISLYTSFVCDALTARFLIKKGKKSLEAINEAIFHLAEVSNRKGKHNFQQPVFRSSVGGTIFFDVEVYNPYKIANVYEETDNYIIYNVEPVHHANAKRLSVKVILRFQSSMEQIAEIATEIKDKVLNYDVYQNEIAEAHYKGRAANIVWCYFGYDEMIWLIVILFVILHGLMMHKTKNIGIVHQKILSLQRELTLMYTVHMI